MKRLLTVGVLSTIALSVSAMAASGSYVGVKGGYNDIRMIDGINTDHYFINVHGGYLFPVTQNFALGPQIGATYYGRVDTDPKAYLYSFNLLAAGEYMINKFYVEGRFGALLGSIHTGSSNKSSLALTAGIGGGYYFTQDFSAGVTYDHTFGKNYADNPQDLSDKKFPNTNSYGVNLTWHF